MPAKYVRPYSKGQKNDFRDAEAIAEAVQRPTNPSCALIVMGICRQNCGWRETTQFYFFALGRPQWRRLRLCR